MNGYSSPEYAESLAEFGTAERLPRSGGYYLKRPIGDESGFDGMSCYPLFDCRDWPGLADDLQSLEGQLVTLTAVITPLARVGLDALSEWFPDLARPFKDHYVIEYPTGSGVRQGAAQFASRHHRYYARRALRDVDVQQVRDPRQLLKEWVTLYGHLIARHNLSGLHAFSPLAFQHQLATPGIVAFRAVKNHETVAAQLWYQDKEVAYSHLFAANATGYETNAAYALYWHAIDYFADKVRWVNLGGAAGAGNHQSGLDFFKRGWSNQVRPALLCGRILDRNQYETLCRQRGVGHQEYFPAYRHGELVGRQKAG